MTDESHENTTIKLKKITKVEDAVSINLNTISSHAAQISRSCNSPDH